MELKSDLLEKKLEETKKPDYLPEEEDYLKGLRERMTGAKDNRDKGHDEFDGMDYATHYESNERLANTFVKPKENKEDTNFQSGMIRQKLFALLSAINNLDLSGDISAFDPEGFKIQAFGDAMEIIRDKCNEMDNDDEKKFLRQFELLKHGTVFVEEIWKEKNKKSKKSNRKFDGKLKGFTITSSIKKALAYPCRNIIPGINVYLGDITQYESQNQPFIFTVDVIPYSEAKRVFEKWDRWENVPKKLVKTNTDTNITAFNHEWTLLQQKDGYVEILRYQDKPNNEYALVVNGVLMTPIGLSLSDVWGYEGYNIEQQNLEPIHAKFAYGKSLVARTKNKVAILDEMMKLAILKTQKSFLPPYVNLSGRIISSRVFYPGKISTGIPANALVPISDKEVEGVTNSELAMIKEIQDSVNNETTSPIFSGQEPKGSPTATQIIELQRQAKMVLGLTVFAMVMLEWKLEWLRLKNNLAHWFEPNDQVVDEMRGVLKDAYRKITTEAPIDGEGMGIKMVIPSKEIPSGPAIMKAEDRMTEEYGSPVRMVFVSPEEITNAKKIWKIVIKPKEKKTSEVSKLMFREFMMDIMPLGPNIEYIRQRAASVWEETPSKLFAQDPEQMQQEAMEKQMGEEGAMPGMKPRVKLPTAQGAMANNIKMQV